MTYLVHPALGVPLEADDVLDAFDLARRCGVGTRVTKDGVEFGRVVTWRAPTAAWRTESVGVLGEGGE